VKPWLLALAALFACGCGPDCGSSARSERTNVILVTIDTLRADHLGCYGNPTVKTPNLDALAADGAIFERCWSQTHLTVPSHMSIMTSRPLAEHGVIDNTGTGARAVPALPGIFDAAGYRTAAFVGARLVSPRGTLGSVLQGFGTWHGPERISVPFRAEETNRDVFRWLRRSCRDPFFLWVHYWDAHMPYAPPAPFDRAYFDGDPRDPSQTSMRPVVLNWFFHDLADLPRRLAREAALVRRLKTTLATNSRGVRRTLIDPSRLPADVAPPEDLHTLAARVRRGLPYKRPLAGWLTGVTDLRFPLAQYAGEVSYVDHAIGGLRAEIERLGIVSRTAMVVTADHGESLGEHGVYFDHFGLHEADLRVPLIVWAPGRVAHARHLETATGLDVAPTVLRLAGLPPVPVMRGRDLLSPPPPDEPVVVESASGLQLGIVDGNLKLIRSLRRFHYVDAFARDAGATELYDLIADPGERDDLAARRPDVRDALARRLDAWIAAHPGAAVAAPPRDVSPDKMRELRALGYVE